MNKTLLERVRCILSLSGMPICFLAKAINITTYIIYRYPSVAIELKHLELWTNKLVNLDCFRNFGHVAHSHVNQGKLQARSLKCYFVSYPLGVKGYKFWYPFSSECIISRNVVFNKLLFCKDSNVEPTIRNDKGTEIEVEVDATLSYHANGTGSEFKALTVPQQTFINIDKITTSDDNESIEDTNIPYGSYSKIHDYQLDKDRTRRTIKVTIRYFDYITPFTSTSTPFSGTGQASLISYSLSIASNFIDDEPKSYFDAFN